MGNFLPWGKIFTPAAAEFGGIIHLNPPKMALPNIFHASVRQQLAARLSRLDAHTAPRWGKMNAPQMLAHLNAMFALGVEPPTQRTPAPVRFLLRALVKPKLVSDTPYAPNSRTAPEMRITHQPDFPAELARLQANLAKLDTLDEAFFAQRPHPAFGPLTATEWSQLFYKHIDHHLNQFGV